MIKPLVNALASLVTRKSEGVFLTPDIKKLVRAHVKDPHRVGQILGHLDQYEAVSKEFRQSKQERVRQFQALQKSRDTQPHELELLLQEDMTAHQILQTKLIQIRTQAQKLIDPGEWEAIRRSAAKTAHAVWEQRQRIIRDFNDARLKIEAKAEKVIQDRGRLREVRSILKTFWRHLADVNQARNVKPTSHTILGNREATQADLRKAVDDVNRIRQEAYDAFLQAHGKLVENITEREWKKIF